MAGQLYWVLLGCYGRCALLILSAVGNRCHPLSHTPATLSYKHRVLAAVPPSGSLSHYTLFYGKVPRVQSPGHPLTTLVTEVIVLTTVYIPSVFQMSAQAWGALNLSDQAELP